MKRFVLPAVFLAIAAAMIAAVFGRNASQQQGSVNGVSTKRTKPTGIIAVKEIDLATGQSLHEDVYAKPFVSGVALRVEWKQLEPQKGKYDWKILDDVFTKGNEQNKFVVLILVPGFGAPDWVLQEVETAPFTRKYGKGAGEEARLPIPWDKRYLATWFEFLKTVSKRYGTNPAFRMVALAGPTSVSAEMSLPNTEADIDTWIRTGYTPQKYVDAWKQTIREYVHIFPKQYVSLALYPGLPINSKGEKDLSVRAATRQMVIDGGLGYPNQFALQTSGLHAGVNVKKEQKREERKSSRLEKRAIRRGEEVIEDDTDAQGAGYDIVSSLAGKILTGFQLSTSATRNPTKMGDAKDPVHALRLSLEQGVEAGASYIEVYEPDILNPAMGDVLGEIAGQFPSEEACKPKPVYCDGLIKLGLPISICPVPQEGWCK